MRRVEILPTCVCRVQDDARDDAASEGGVRGSGDLHGYGVSRTAPALSATPAPRTRAPAPATPVAGAPHAGGGGRRGGWGSATAAPLMHTAIARGASAPAAPLEPPVGAPAAGAPPRKLAAALPSPTPRPAPDMYRSYGALPRADPRTAATGAGPEDARARGGQGLSHTAGPSALALAAVAAGAESTRGLSPPAWSERPEHSWSGRERAADGDGDAFTAAVTRRSPAGAAAVAAAPAPPPPPPPPRAAAAGGAEYLPRTASTRLHAGASPSRRAGEEASPRRRPEDAGDESRGRSPRPPRPPATPGGVGEDASLARALANTRAALKSALDAISQSWADSPSHAAVT